MVTDHHLNEMAPRRFMPLTAVAAVLIALPLWAAPPILTPAGPSCVPARANSVVAVTVQPPSGWSSVRVYFREAGSNDFYYLEMRAGQDGRYWAALPRPVEHATAVDLQVAVKDAEGKETRGPMQRVAVTAGCNIVLTPEEASFAQNLVVGETAPAQKNSAILGFLCVGVISRIDSTGVLSSDEYCRKALLAEAAGAEGKRKVLVPLLVVGGAGGAIAVVRHNEKHEASPSHP